jgi:hypothetical protein
MTRMYLVAALVAVLMLSGCGGGSKTAGNTTHPKVFIEWDDSGFTRFAQSYKDEIVGAIHRIAAANGEIFAVVLDGQPITTASITERNFAEAPPGAEPQEMPAINQAVAEGFAKKFIATLTEHETVLGSGQLQGLRIAANTPGVTEIILWSDGVVNEPNDGFDLTTATAQDVATEIKRWMPTLAALRGKRVVVVGVGRGAHHVITVERAQRLCRAVVEGNGGHLVWTQTLAQLSS